MFFHHASYAFPSEWVLLLDVGLTVLLGAWLLVDRRHGHALARRIWHRLRETSRRPARLVVALGLAATLANALYTAAVGFPIPAISDELGHLLLADTFAHGRLTNPPPPAPRYFEAEHVILDPVYTAKYPPGIGALLAFGQVVGGHPGIGVWLGSGLLAGAACWAVAPFLPPPWPLLGALLVTFRLGLGSYWGHSYWGGALPAAAAFVLFGSVARMRRSTGPANALALAVALAVLATTRPWEGLAVALVCAVPVTACLVRSTGRGFRRVLVRWLVPFTLGMAAMVAFLAAYNHEVTGDSLVFPDWHYREATGFGSAFTFRGSSSEPAAYGFDWGAFAPRTLLSSSAGMLSRSAFFLLGTPLLVGLAGLVSSPWRRWQGWALAAWLLCALFLALDSGGFVPHYASPALAAATLLALAGLRRLATRLGGRRPDRRVPVLALAISLLLCLIQLPAWRPDAGDWSRRRAALLAGLEAQGGTHLVLVPDELRRAAEWISNRADWAGAPVLLAADRPPHDELLAAFPERTVWRLVPEPSPGWPSLVRQQETADTARPGTSR